MWVRFLGSKVQQQHSIWKSEITATAILFARSCERSKCEKRSFSLFIIFLLSLLSHSRACIHRSLNAKCCQNEAWELCEWVGRLAGSLLEHSHTTFPILVSLISPSRSFLVGSRRWWWWWCELSKLSWLTDKKGKIEKSAELNSCLVIAVYNKLSPAEAK